MIERIRELASTGLRGAAGRLPAQTLRSVQVARWMLRTLADAIEPIQVVPLPDPTPVVPKAAPGPACTSPPPVQIATPPPNGSAAKGAAAATAPTFHKAARVSELAPGTGAVVEVGGRTLALFNVDGTVHAIDNKCLHRGGPVGEGELAGGIVTCPWHGWRYDVTTGKCENNPGAQLPCHRVKLEGEEIWVEV